MSAPASSAACCRDERRRRHAEVGARRRVRAPDAVAPLDDVEIDLEDARLRQRRLEPPRDDQLAQLAQRIARGREIQVLGELLRDACSRRAARRRVSSACCIGHADLLDVDPLVLPERAVFGDQHGALQVAARCASTAPSADRSEGLAVALGLARPQLHERGGLRVGGGERPHVGHRQVDVDDGAERQRAGHARASATAAVPFLARNDDLDPRAGRRLRARRRRGSSPPGVAAVTAPADRPASAGQVSPAREPCRGRCGLGRMPRPRSPTADGS